LLHLSVILAPFVLAATFVGLPPCEAARPDEAKEPRPEDVKLLQDAGVATDGPGLLAFFRKQTLSDEQRRAIAESIKELGDDDFEVRQRASAKLIALKAAAVPALRHALNHRDAEVASRAKACMSILGSLPPGDVRAAAAWALIVRKPPQAVEVLLAFLPDIADAAEEDRIVAALTALGVRDGNVAPALLAALRDKLPVRRAIAAEILAAVGDANQRAAVRKLLTDADRGVRLHVAVALTCARDKVAVPVLIDVAADMSRDQTREAQELLRLLAGANAPRAVPGGQPAARKQYRDAWNAWWKEQGAAVDLAQIETGPPKKAKVSARASRTWAERGGTPDGAFEAGGWGSDGYAPQWIEADLGAPTRLASLWMKPCQDPAVCNTTHEIWMSDEPIGDDRTKAKLVHRFKGQTESEHPLACDFPKGLAGRYVQIRTTESASWVSWRRIEIRVGRTRSPFVRDEGP
jgi:hypothetical protein